MAAAAEEAGRPHGAVESDSDAEHNASGARPGPGPVAKAVRSLPCSLPTLATLAAIGVLTSVGLGVFIGTTAGRRHAQPEAQWTAIDVVPDGVNFGGWLVLEDWFFSGAYGRNVMSRLQSPTGPGQGFCLPPLLQGMNEPWPSEGVLVKRLVDKLGEKETVKIFAAHRHSFISTTDWRKVADLGVRSVRLPLPWFAFADALEPVDARYALSPSEKIVPDPFYGANASFVTVDRTWLAQVLRQAAHYGVRVLLDIHMMPGGSSDGTYNGVWPLPPAFWMRNATDGGGNELNVTLAQAGLWVADAMIKWVEGLDEVAFGGVLGLTVMNEPAHTAAWAKVPFVSGDGQILGWLAEAADLFRSSTLPQRGVKLYMNVIDTSIRNYWETVPHWYMRTFSTEERYSWVVFDIHWYTSWSGGTCDGRVAPGGKYFCDQPIDDMRQIVRTCQDRETPGRASREVEGLKSCTEFSLGTFEDAVLACNDPDLLRAFLEEQVNNFRRLNLESFFWTWRMPYGPVFERGWSLKHISGLEKLSPPHSCMRTATGFVP